MLPAPFTIAIVLSVFAFFFACIFGKGENYSHNGFGRVLDTAEIWYTGLWNPGGFSFAMQMMLMLLLGHVMALSTPIDKLLTKLSSSSFCANNTNAAVTLTFLTILVSLFNWGLGLVFGALFARKIAEQATLLNKQINYGFIGACGYVGLMVWHAGISGSAPIKVADSKHIAELMEGVTTLKPIPVSIPLSETIFSNMNMAVMLTVLLLIPFFAWLLSKKVTLTTPDVKPVRINEEPYLDKSGAEKIDHSIWVSKLIGGFIVSFSMYKIINSDQISSLGFLTPNFINFILLGGCLLLHKNINSFLKGIDQAIGGVSGILIQFPIYYGIMALMIDSGISSNISIWIGNHTSINGFPVVTYITSGIMNVFVPSGGGQWVVQGPIIIETALNKGIPLSKSIMSMAYGDQLTNMLQPFWALPLLGITGLKAKQILPYTLMFMVVGFIIYLTALIIF